MASLPSSEHVFVLNNGTTVPAIGLGTFQGDAGNSQVKDVVLAALEKGYRHIDCATAYGNEVQVGQAIQESGVARQELFVTTKLHQTWHQPSDVAEALDNSLSALQLDYECFSLRPEVLPTKYTLVPHAYKPGPGHTTLRDPSGNGKPVIDLELSRAYPEVWAAMEKLVDNGKARSIGLSNFNILKTKRILEGGRIRPAVNQVELHPYLPQHELLDFSKQEGIHLMAHQPLGGMPVLAVNPNASRPGPLHDPQITQIAADIGRTPAQVILSWSVQRGTSVIPKTIHDHRLVENLDLFTLSKDHFNKIDALASEVGPVRYLDPRGHIGFNIFDETRDEPI